MAHHGLGLRIQDMIDHKERLPDLKVSAILFIKFCLMVINFFFVNDYVFCREIFSKQVFQLGKFLK